MSQYLIETTRHHFDLPWCAQKELGEFGKIIKQTSGFEYEPFQSNYKSKFALEVCPPVSVNYQEVTEHKKIESKKKERQPNPNKPEGKRTCIDRGLALSCFVVAVQGATLLP